MAEHYNLDLIKQVQLISSINDTQTTMTVAPGQGALFIEPRCIAVLSSSRSIGDLQNAEHVIMESRSGDVYTIERGTVGTAAAWSAGTYVLGYWSPEHLYEIERSIDKIEGFISQVIGGGSSAVVRNSGSTYLKITNPSGSTIACSAGWAMINGEIFQLEDAIADVGVPPPYFEGDTYSIYAYPPTQLLPNGGISYISGTTVPANTLKLGERTLIGSSIIVSDLRTFL